MSRNPELVAHDLAQRGLLIVPSPLLSRGGAAFASEDPPRWARQVGVGPSHVLVSWACDVALGSDGVPQAYRIESSADSRDGRDGAWRIDSSITGNAASGRAQLIEFDGQSWVRFSVDVAGGGVHLRRFDVHDASDGADDCWLVLGDALAESAFSLEEGAPPSFAELVHGRHPGYYPAIIGEGRRGEGPAQTLARLPQLLELHHHARHVLLAYGSPADAGAAHIDALLRGLLEAGRVPVIAHWPDAGVAAELAARHRLAPGPELHGVLATPRAVDGDRLSAHGREQVQRELAEALDVFYVPQ